MSGSGMDWSASRGASLQGEIVVPGDKSVSHRAIMLASLADGVSRINGFLEGEDARATEAIFRQLGVRIDTPVELEYYKNGGILQYVLRQLAAA